MGEGFGRWFFKSKFDLMEDHAERFASADAAEARRSFAKAVRHGKRVLVARLVVTVLLASGALATVVSNVLLDAVAGYAASATVALLLARLAFDRYVDLVATSATFHAMVLARAGR